MALEGESIDIINSNPGIGYLVSKANPKGYFIEENYKNHEAWVKFNLQRDSNGNPKITLVDHSQCTDGLCGGDFPNR